MAYRCGESFRLHSVFDDLSVRTLCVNLTSYTVELQWVEHLWDHKNMFETGVVRANEC